jgi:acetyl-CoA synthetase
MNEAVRGGKTIDLKKTVDAAVSQSPSVKHVLVVNRTQNKFQLQTKDVIVDDVIFLKRTSLTLIS